ncbi:MAG TPA: protein-L-isoaspartate(D-aspartate) O-methyltransferase [Terriglobia bacterium]|nr:protein-L-isoaspartate(D-aspartate) O-methyltransferase [Terriglobia bacterium]
MRSFVVGFVFVLLLLIDCTAMLQTKETFNQQREEMVVQQIAGRDVTDKRVLEAMTKVPRHLFVFPGEERYAYEDRPLPIGHGQTISQPYIVALMTEVARINKEDVVLEIGTGSGYQAAVLSVLASQVYSIEYIEALGREARERLKSLGYNNVEVKIGDGYEGWPEHQPFDAILVTAAIDHIPQRLIDQLKPGGRLVIPLGGELENQVLRVVEKDSRGVISHQDIIPVRFVPFLGEHVKSR